MPPVYLVILPGAVKTARETFANEPAFKGRLYRDRQHCLPFPASSRTSGEGLYDLDRFLKQRRG